MSFILLQVFELWANREQVGYIESKNFPSPPSSSLFFSIRSLKPQKEVKDKVTEGEKGEAWEIQEVVRTSQSQYVLITR